MAFFTEQMEMLTNELLTSRRARVAFVHDVELQSHTIVAEAQAFMQNLTKEQKANAVRLRAELLTHDKERQSASKTQRQQNREHIKTARKGLLDMLAQNRSQRTQTVAKMRKDLASDFKQAGQVWQRMLNVGATTNGVVKGKVKVTAGATVSHAAAHVEAKPHEQARHQPTAAPVKAEETTKPMEHGHASEHKKPVHDATHGNHGKPKEPRHSH